MTRRRLTTADDAFIRARYSDLSAAEIATILGCGIRSVYNRANALGIHKNPEWIAERARRRSLSPDHGGRATRFNADQVPWNKGKPYDAGGRSAETRFKPGHRSGRAGAMWQPVGSLRINSDGYLQRKVNDDAPFYKRWRAEHIVVWEAANGPLPAGHAIVFKDGDKMNCDLENLECITRQELMLRNTVHRYGPEIAGLSQLRGALKRQINKLTKNQPGEATK